MSGAPKKTVLVMCNNPTADGPLEWEGHEMVAYVGDTPPVRTQEEHKARLNDLKTKYATALADDERNLAELPDDDSPELDELYTSIAGNREAIAEVNELLTIPLPVEELSKIYYQRIDTVPGDLKVDVVISAGCPLDPHRPATFEPGSVHADLRTAVERHLKPGGEFYFMGGNWQSFHPSIQSAFSPLVDYDREEKANIGSDYLDARWNVRGQGSSVLVRKVTGGRRRNRKTYRRRPKRKLTRKRK